MKPNVNLLVVVFSFIGLLPGCATDKSRYIEQTYNSSADFVKLKEEFRRYLTKDFFKKSIDTKNKYLKATKKRSFVHKKIMSKAISGMRAEKRGFSESKVYLYIGRMYFDSSCDLAYFQQKNAVGNSTLNDTRTLFKKALFSFQKMPNKKTSQKPVLKTSTCGVQDASSADMNEILCVCDENRSLWSR